MALLTLKATPSWGSSREVKHRVRSAEYGDGYEQKLRDGINSTYQVWELVFQGVTEKVDAIDKFLIDRGGQEAFLWLPPGEPAPLTFRAGDHKRVFNAFNDESINVTFTQKFGVE